MPTNVFDDTLSAEVMITDKPTVNTITTPAAYTQQSNFDDVLIAIIMIVSFVIISTIVVGVYKWFQRKHKQSNVERVAAVIKVGAASDISRNNRNTGDNNIECIQSNAKNNTDANAAHDSDKSEDMYEDYNNHKTRKETIITNKGQDNDTEGVPVNVVAENGYHGPILDCEGCVSSIQNIVDHTTNHSDSPGLV